MQLPITRSASELGSRRTPRGDRIMRALIVGSGVAVLLMLAWAHLGLSALIIAPAATPPRMVASSGRYVVTLYADSGQLAVGDGNTVSLEVRDRANFPVTGATVRVAADMITMAMPVPDTTATAQGGGRYAARLVFSMSGPWRLIITVAAPNQASVQVAFDVGVRWH